MHISCHDRFSTHACFAVPVCRFSEPFWSGEACSVHAKANAMAVGKNKRLTKGGKKGGTLYAECGCSTAAKSVFITCIHDYNIL